MRSFCTAGAPFASRRLVRAAVALVASRTSKAARLAVRAPPAISTCALASCSSGLADSVTVTTWASPSPPEATSSAAACAARPAMITQGPSCRTSLLGDARLLPGRLICRICVAAPRDHVEIAVVELAVLPLQVGQDDERIDVL